jgi:hypothetical protein
MLTGSSSPFGGWHVDLGKLTRYRLVLMRSFGVHFPARRVALHTAILAAAMISARSDLSAQAIRIVEPTEWRDLRAATLEANQPLRILGSASHTSGVVRVLINGTEITLARESPTFGRFEKVFQPGEVPSEIIIVVVPRTGQQIEQRFTVNVTAPVQTPVTTVPPPAATQTPAPVLDNPWRPFTYRSLGYGAMAAGGVVLLSGDSQGAGYALVGIAVTAFVVDLVMTSRKAKRGSTPENNDASNLSLRFSPALLPAQTTRPGVQVQLRFR